MKKQNGCAFGLFFFSLWPFCMIPLPYFHALLVFAFINPSPFFRDLNCYKKRPTALPSPATPSLPVISRLGSGGGALLSCYARCPAVIGRIFLRCLPGHRVPTLSSHWGGGVLPNLLCLLSQRLPAAWDQNRSKDAEVLAICCHGGKN